MTDTTDQQAWEDWLRGQIEAYHASALISAAVLLGLPELMQKQSSTVDMLAQELGLSPPHLHRFLRALATLGICEELPDGRFASKARGQALLASASSGLGEKARIVVEQYWRPWAGLPAALRSGEPSFDHVFGASIHDWRNAHPEEAVAFHTYFAKQSFAGAGPIIEALALDEPEIIADLGGGYGGLLAAILSAQPNARGILFDRPPTLEAAAYFLASTGVAERVTRLGGDILIEIPVEADRYLLHAVLQQWDDDRAGKILRNCRAAMRPDAKLMVIERLLPDRAVDDPAAVMSDMHMLVVSGGRVRRLADFNALLGEAGLERRRLATAGNGISIIEAVPR